MELISNDFSENGIIPSKFTCDGENISPELKLLEVPDSAKSLALIVDDPDSPAGSFVHWVIYNMPAYKLEIEQNFPKNERFTDGTLQGTNDFRNIGYDGPCPRSGVHRYYFKLYAVDTFLNLPPGAIKIEVMRAMKDHIVSQTELIGHYKKK